MPSDPDRSATRMANDSRKSITRRFLDMLNEFDKALDYDPFLELSAKVQRLEKEISEVKRSLPTK